LRAPRRLSPVKRYHPRKACHPPRCRQRPLTLLSATERNRAATARPSPQGLRDRVPADPDRASGRNPCSCRLPG
jgi:hypothetical protein